jgi:hypothetical protein
MRCKLLTVSSDIPTKRENFIGQESACCSEIMHIQFSVQLSGIWLCMLVKTAKVLEEKIFLFRPCR